MTTDDSPLTGEGVWIEQKLNVQCPDNTAASAKLTVLMGVLKPLICGEASAVIDALTALPSGETKLVYPTSRKMRLTDDGTCAYLRLEVTTTRMVAYPELAKLTENIMAAFVEKIQQLMLSLDEHCGSVLKMALVDLEHLLLDPDSKLSGLVGTGLPQVVDRT
jgi:hypothetical protein